jgi:hypothetical protein
VAAHDVLSALQEGPNLAAEARRTYFPHIRATSALLRNEEAKVLAEIVFHLFPDVETAVECALAVETFPVGRQSRVCTFDRPNDGRL